MFIFSLSYQFVDWTGDHDPDLSCCWANHSTCTGRQPSPGRIARNRHHTISTQMPRANLFH